MAKKAKHARVKKPLYLRSPSYKAPRHQFAVRPGGPRGISTRPPKNLTNPGPIPAWFAKKYPLGSLIEWWAWWWLVNVAHLTPHDGHESQGVLGGFGYQVPAAGGRVQGGQVIDFVIYKPRPIALLINGNHWHFGGGTRTLQASISARNQLTSLGYTAVMVWEAAMKLGLDGVMRKALDGIEEPLPLNVGM